MNDLFLTVGGTAHIINPEKTYQALMATNLASLGCDQIIFDPDAIETPSRGYNFNHVLDKLEQLGFSISIEHHRGVAQRAIPLESLQKNDRLYQLEQDLSDIDIADIIKGVRYQPRDTGDGVIYLAIGARYFREAQRSAATLIRQNPGLPVTIFSDQGHGQLPVSYSFIQADRSPFKLKMESMKRSPYERTIFLDSDTLILSDLAAMINNLKKCDFCICRAPSFHYENGHFVFDNYQHESTLNTGVIGFGSGIAVRGVLNLWSDTMVLRGDDEIWAGHLGDQFHFNDVRATWAGHLGDQFHFNDVVIKSPEFTRINSQILDNKIYNLRTYALGEAINDGSIANTKIIHGKKWEARKFWSVDFDQFVIPNHPSNEG